MSACLKNILYYYTIRDKGTIKSDWRSEIDMRKIKVYLDTSVISYLSQDDAPERMRDTHEL